MHNYIQGKQIPWLDNDTTQTVQLHMKVRRENWL
jgi:hypothetical protein